MRTIRMAALMCLAACNLYFDDPPRRSRPDAGDKVPPDAFVLDGNPCDNGPPNCGRDGGGPLPDAQIDDGGCNGVDCYPDAGVGDGGCHGLPDAAVGDGGCNGVDCYPDAGYPDAHH